MSIYQKSFNFKTIYQLDFTLSFSQSDIIDLITSETSDKYDSVQKFLLDHPNEINYVCNLNITPLMLACIIDDPCRKSLVKLLLDYGADVNALDDFGTTALYYAATGPITSDNLEIVELLLDHGAELNTVYSDNIKYRFGNNESIFMKILSVRTFYEFSMHFMFNYDLNFSWTYPLGFEKMMKLLLDYGADIHTKNDLGENILVSLAFRHIDLNMYRWVLDCDVDPNNCDNRGNSVLSQIVSGNNRQGFDAVVRINVYSYIRSYVELLLEYDANINSTNIYQMTPLFHSIDNTELFMLLIKHGANVMATDDHDNNLLMHVCRNLKDINALEMVKFLLNNYAFDINKQNKYGETALILTLHANRSHELVIFLLENGSDVNKSMNNGINPLMLAVYYHYPLKIIELSLEMSSHVNQQTETGESALFFALYGCGSIKICFDESRGYYISGFNNNIIEIVKLLLAYDANPNLTNDKGMTPIMYLFHGIFQTIKNSSLGSEVAFEPDYTSSLISLCQLLLDHGANFYHVDNTGQTLMDYAKILPNVHAELINFLENL